MTNLATENQLATEVRAREVTFLRFGAVCAVVGTVGYLVAFLLHGNLPDETTESLLTYIARRPWALHHMAIVFCFLLWIVALTGLAQSLKRSGAWVLGRLGLGCAMLGMGVLLWHYNIDGPALEQVADAWAASSGAEQAVHLERGTVLTMATNAMFPLYVTLLLGLPFILFGIAIVLSTNYPSWLGWIAAAAGAVSFIAGTTNFVGLDVLPIELFVITVFVLDVWMIVIARVMSRRAASLRSQPIG
ncbi:hypothetical protein [Saccharopolyspora elongata]|uniref:DUF4386 family protein n=1 Tax=Saccharopolyspora elongata TaxID=2530387 RepID=A0A4R4YAU0_9PSEU|nr:hypothetical protein [Saccharopolyspora elongata]TDD41553.1 hypothetical protein E1288_32290 [Saccharopolyspora elongata]